MVSDPVEFVQSSMQAILHNCLLVTQGRAWVRDKTCSHIRSATGRDSHEVTVLFHETMYIIGGTEHIASRPAKGGRSENEIKALAAAATTILTHSRDALLETYRLGTVSG
jgi:hypothetical protein